MNAAYKAKVISINGDTVTYEYTDRNGFVQISSLMPTGIKLRKGDTVWITVNNGVVVSVGKRRKVLSTPFGVKLIALLIMLIVLAVLWLIFVIIKKLIIAFIWVIVIFIAGAFIFTRPRK